MEFLLLGAEIWRSCILGANLLNSVGGVKGSIRRAYRRALTPPGHFGASAYTGKTTRFEHRLQRDLAFSKIVTHYTIPIGLTLAGNTGSNTCASPWTARTL